MRDEVTLKLVNHAKNLSWEKTAITYAVTWCLSDKAACQALDAEIEMANELRRGLLKRICSGITNGGLLPCHIELIDGLLNKFSTLPFKHRAKCAYCLCELFDVLPLEFKIRILALFLQAPFITIRRRGYKKGRKTWDESYHPLFEKAWQEFGDPECALAIVERFNAEFVLREFDKLWAVLTEPWQVARLFLRIAEQNKNLLLKLADFDEISFAYVRAKIGLPLKAHEAIAIFERSITDSRIGLLIWAIGKMKLIDALSQIISRANEFKVGHFPEQDG